MKHNRFLLAVIASAFTGATQAAPMFNGDIIVSNHTYAEGVVTESFSFQLKGDSTTRYELDFLASSNNASLITFEILSPGDLQDQHLMSPPGNFSVGGLLAGDLLYGMKLSWAINAGGGNTSFKMTSVVTEGYVMPPDGGNTGGTVPEPASLALVLLGLTTIAARSMVAKRA